MQFLSVAISYFIETVGFGSLNKRSNAYKVAFIKLRLSNRQCDEPFPTTVDGNVIGQNLSLLEM